MAYDFNLASEVLKVGSVTFKYAMDFNRACFDWFALQPGDLIFTGTPEGVAAVQRGDLLEGVVAGVGTVRTRIV